MFDSWLIWPITNLNIVDPEVKKELEDMQKSKKSVTASTNQLATRDFAGDFASWMAGSSGQKEKRWPYTIQGVSSYGHNENLIDFFH